MVDPTDTPSSEEPQDNASMLSSQEEGEEESLDNPFDSASIKPKLVQITDSDLKAMQKELVEYKDKYLRLLADAENARKRMQKERQEMTRFAIESLIIDFLKPLDNFENALGFAQGMSEEVKNWALGFQMILSQFKDILAQHGIHSFESLGQSFNPHDHEAIEMIESTTLPPGVIIEESVRGYKMGERTIRAARVKVSKAGNT